MPCENDGQLPTGGGKLVPCRHLVSDYPFKRGANTMIDPVCGMNVKPEPPAAQSQEGGQTYYFCSAGCKQKFDQDPQQYASQPKPQDQRT